MWKAIVLEIVVTVFRIIRDAYAERAKKAREQKAP